MLQCLANCSHFVSSASKEKQILTKSLVSMCTLVLSNNLTENLTGFNDRVNLAYGRTAMEQNKMSLTWHTTLLWTAALIFLFSLLINEISAQDPIKPWYENLPAVAMDYKVHIDAGKEDCYYQYVQAGATFYVSFSVSATN